MNYSAKPNKVAVSVQHALTSMSAI